MPNLSGTILAPNLIAPAIGTVLRFTRHNEVNSYGINLWSMGRVETETDADGRFGPINLAPGKFLLEWLYGFQQNRLIFNMPTSEVAVELGEIVNNAAVATGANSLVYGATSLREKPYWDGKLAYLLWLDVDGDNNGGWYYYNALSLADHDGVDVIRPYALGFADVGRWIRSGNVT